MDTNNNLKIEAVDERTRNKNYSFDVAILKMMATLFITWFHFKSLAPTSLQPIFIGGTIGNSLFFFASGYLLKFKSENYVGQWWVKKILRIMPTIWIMYLLISCFDYFRDRVSLTWYNWIYPTTYWFVNAILCFFIIIYLFRSLLRSRIYIIGLVVVVFLLNVLNYYLFVKADEIVMDGGGVKIWFYMFCFFLWGIYEKNYGKKIKPNNWAWINTVLSILIFFFYKKKLSLFEPFIIIQPIVIPILLAYIIYAFRQFSVTLLNIIKPSWILRGIKMIADHTLEIYVVQIYLIEWIGPQLPFPLSILVLIILIFSFSCFVQLITKKIIKLLPSSI